MKGLVNVIKAKMLSPTAGETDANYNFNRGYEYAVKEIIKIIKEIPCQHEWVLKNEFGVGLNSLPTVKNICRHCGEYKTDFDIKDIEQKNYIDVCQHDITPTSPRNGTQMVCSKCGYNHTGKYYQ